jgi:hypothetical protein
MRITGWHQRIGNESGFIQQLEESQSHRDAHIQQPGYSRPILMVIFSIILTRKERYLLVLIKSGSAYLQCTTLVSICGVM